MLKRRLVYIAIFLLSLLDSGAQAFAEAAKNQRFAQIVLPFNSKRPFTYFFSEKDRSLVLDIKDTTPQELGALDQYDENLVRRVVVRYLENKGSQARLTLRDKSIRATVTAFDQPFRIVIDLFDKGFQEERDPVTGFPLTAANTAEGSVNSIRGMGIETPADEISQRASDGGLQAEGRRQLMAPTPADANETAHLNLDVKGIAEGPGKSWEHFPIYIYRFQTSLYKSMNQPQAPRPGQMSSAEALADYAGKLYEFGHEEKSLAIYQQLLHTFSQVLTDDPVNLWRLAEIHLGKGNYILADGYYQSLIEKHPENDLAHLSALRRLDVEVLHGLAKGKSIPWPSLLNRLEKIQAGKNTELAVQMGIRRAYWSAVAEDQERVRTNRYYLPPISEELAQELASQSSRVEGGRTGLLAGALALNIKLEGNIDRETVTQAAAFFKKYRGKSADTLVRPLEEKMRQVLGDKIVNNVNKGKFVEAIELYEAMPRELAWAKDNDRIAWAMGEAYRKLNQPEQAAGHYENAVASRDDQVGRFKASLLQLVTAESAATSKGKKSASQNLQAKVTAADSKLLEIWRQLPEAQKHEIYGDSKSHLEKLVTENARVRSPAVIVLEEWDRSLSTRVATASKENTGVAEGATYSGDSVNLVTKLIDRFTDLKMPTERTRAQNLFKRMSASGFADNKKARSVWTSEMIKLAEEYRTQNDNLEAGRTYALAAKENNEWDGRSEALYKAGLLLFRAGKRDEAVEALKTAAQDKTNLLYADLAQKRLSQIEQ